MRFVIIAAALATACFAVPAYAQGYTYSLEGDFLGRIGVTPSFSGNPISGHLIYSGYDSSGAPSLGAGFYNAPLTNVTLTLFDAATSQSIHYSGSGGRVYLSGSQFAYVGFDSTLDNGFSLSVPLFASWNGEVPLTTPASVTWAGPDVVTDHGRLLGTRMTNATFSITGPVPEPATWLTLLLGFGGVGYALRRMPKIDAQVRFV